ncbi:MAG: alpha/beta fold hydrolase [Micrococcus sp.]|nr:alpha/beta fold hydrolase [Micrococcus sp.]
MQPVDHSPLDERGEAADGPAVLVLHGFTSGPHSVRDWARGLLPVAQRVSIPVLPGHASTWQQLARVRADQWRAAVREHVDTLMAAHDRVVVAGLSMGGALALDAAAHRDLAGCIVVNPSLVFGQRIAHAAPVLRWLVPSVAPIANDAVTDVNEGAYARTPVAGVAQVGALHRAVRRELGAIRCPVQSFYSVDDHVVPTRSQDVLLRGARHARVQQVRLTESFHVATMDRDLPRIIDESRAFIAGLPSRGERGA